MRPYRSLDTGTNVDELVLRLGQLQPTSTRRWGTLSPHEMLCHLGDSFSAVLGERRASAHETWLSRTVVKWIALHTSAPWPQGVPTRPEVDPRQVHEARRNSNAIGHALGASVRFVRSTRATAVTWALAR
jgi:hypothetical protein